MIVFIGCPDTTPDTPGGGSTARYTCENGTPVDGTPVDGTPSGTSNVVACQSCKSGFKLMGSAGENGTTCVQDSTATYTCENGTPVDGTPSGTSDVEECTACNTGFTLTEKKCIADTDSTAPTFTDGPRVDASTDTSATVTLTASEAGKLFWVLYTGSDASPD